MYNAACILRPSLPFSFFSYWLFHYAPIPSIQQVDAESKSLLRAVPARKGCNLMEICYSTFTLNKWAAMLTAGAGIDTGRQKDDLWKQRGHGERDPRDNNWSFRSVLVVTNIKGPIQSMARAELCAQEVGEGCDTQLPACQMQQLRAETGSALKASDPPKDPSIDLLARLTASWREGKGFGF